MGLLSQNKESRQKAARRVLAGHKFLVASAEAARFAYSERPRPEPAADVHAADDSQDSFNNLRNDPYLVALQSMGASEKIYRIAAHAALDMVLNEAAKEE